MGFACPSMYGSWYVSTARFSLPIAWGVFHLPQLTTHTEWKPRALKLLLLLWKHCITDRCHVFSCFCFWFDFSHFHTQCRSGMVLGECGQSCKSDISHQTWPGVFLALAPTQIYVAYWIWFTLHRHIRKMHQQLRPCIIFLSLFALNFSATSYFFRIQLNGI